MSLREFLGFYPFPGFSGNVAGCQSLSLWERCLRSRRRGQGCCQRARHTAIQALFVRDIVSLCFRVLFCRACPLRLLRRHLSQRERLWQSAKSAVIARGSPFGRAGASAPERASPLKKQIPHTGRLRCGGAGMESGNVFKRFCHRRRRCGSCHRRCRCTAPDRGRCAPRPPHRWGRGLQWQKPCSGSRCRPCR